MLLYLGGCCALIRVPADSTSPIWSLSCGLVASYKWPLANVPAISASPFVVGNYVHLTLLFFILDLTSKIFVQGGPGSGKTFYTANAIVELLKKNKKIAVSANSHKVIHNLLERIENIAYYHQKDILEG